MFERRSSLARSATLALVSLLALGAAGCSDDGGTGERDEAQRILQQGLQAHARGDIQVAEDLYLQVIRLDPQNEFAYYNLGVIDHGRGDLESAEERYRTALELDPDFVAALFNLAILRTALGDNDEAVDLYQHIIELEPENAGAHLNLGFVLIAKGFEQRGREELEEAVRLDPGLEGRVAPETPTPEPASE